MAVLQEANLAFLRAVNPRFVDSLPEDSDNPWKICWGGENGDWPVNLQSKQDISETLYPLYQGAIQYDGERIKQWKSAPARLLLNDYTNLGKESNSSQFFDLIGKDRPDKVSLSDVHDLNQDLEVLWLQEELGLFVRENSITLSYSPPSSTDCLLVVSGLGLGGQLKDLIDWLNPSALFIVEPDIGVLSHSLHTVDYQWLVNKFSGPNKTLEFIISKSPDSAVGEIRSLITTRNLFYLDGLFTYVNFDTPFYQLIKQGLHSAFTLNSVNYLGYFLDEVHMTMNAYINYSKLSPRVFNTTKIVSNECNAVVVASGPSLSQNIDLLKKERNRYTLFSCYSTIGALFDSGLIPDYHCDLERHNDHLPLIERGYKEKLKAVDLCCSSTCDPRLLTMYRDVYSINRGALTPSVIFSESNDIISNEGPDVATFAILCAIYFGFRKIHLFGVDLGTADRTLCRLPGALDIDRRSYDIPDRGNHGKTVFTSQHLLDNKVAIEGNISLYGRVFQNLQVFNYSNGVLIKGAEPSQPSDFSFRLSHEVTHGKPEKPAFQAYSIEHVENAWKLADLRKRCFAYLNTVRDLAKRPFDIDTQYKISDLCNAYNKSNTDQIPIRFYRGTLFRCWAVLNGVYQRANFNDDKTRLEFINKATSLLETVIASFENLTFEMTDYVENLQSVDHHLFESKLSRDDYESKPIQFGTAAK